MYRKDEFSMSKSQGHCILFIHFLREVLFNVFIKNQTYATSPPRNATGPPLIKRIFL